MQQPDPMPLPPTGSDAPALGGVHAIQRTGYEPALRLEQSIPALLRGLEHPRPGPRLRAVDLLVRCGVTALPGLIDLLRSGPLSVRPLACVALGRIGDQAAVPILAAALHGPDPTTCIAAAAALGEIGDPSCVTYLLPLVRQAADEKLCAAACDALGALGDPRALPELLDALDAGDRFVRAAAAQALGRIGHPGAIPGLRRAFRDPHWMVSEAAYEALHHIRSM